MWMAAEKGSKAVLINGLDRPAQQQRAAGSWQLAEVGRVPPSGWSGEADPAVRRWRRAAVYSRPASSSTTWKNEFSAGLPIHPRSSVSCAAVSLRTRFRGFADHVAHSRPVANTRPLAFRSPGAGPMFDSDAHGARDRPCVHAVASSSTTRKNAGLSSTSQRVVSEDAAFDARRSGSSAASAAFYCLTLIASLTVGRS